MFHDDIIVVDDIIVDDMIVDDRERKSKVKKAPLPPGSECSVSPLSSPSHTRSTDGHSLSRSTDGHSLSRSSDGHSLSRSTDGHNSPSTVQSQTRSTSDTEKIYPTLTSVSDTTPDTGHSNIGWSGAVTSNGSTHHPVPAPRTIKPALPNKPDSINLSRYTLSN